MLARLGAPIHARYARRLQTSWPWPNLEGQGWRKWGDMRSKACREWWRCMKWKGRLTFKDPRRARRSQVCVLAVQVATSSHSYWKEGVFCVVPPWVYARVRGSLCVPARVVGLVADFFWRVLCPVKAVIGFSGQRQCQRLWCIWIAKIFNGERPWIDDALSLSHESPEGFIIKLRACFDDGCFQHAACGANEPLPGATHMACVGHIHLEGEPFTLVQTGTSVLCLGLSPPGIPSFRSVRRQSLYPCHNGFAWLDHAGLEIAVVHWWRKMCFENLSSLGAHSSTPYMWIAAPSASPHFSSPWWEMVQKGLPHSTRMEGWARAYLREDLPSSAVPSIRAVFWMLRIGICDWTPQRIHPWSNALSGATHCAWFLEPCDWLGGVEWATMLHDPYEVGWSDVSPLPAR